VSGGYGSGGYPGQGYGAPDYDGDPGRTRPRRQGGQPRGYGPGWQGGDQGYPGYDPRAGYGGQEYGGPGHDPRGYGPPYGPPPGGGRYQGTGPRQDQYGTGSRRPRRGAGQPGAGQRGAGQPGADRRQRGGYDPRAGGGGYDQRGYDDWDQEQDDSSFLPGFGGREEYQDPRAGQRAPGRDDRYDYDDRRGQGWSDGRAPDPRGPGSGPGNGPRDWDDWDDRNRQPRKKATRWIPRALVLTVVVVIVVGGLVGGLDIYHKYQARYHPADYAGQGTGNVTVQVMSGDTAFSLAPRLLQLGVIASTRAFTNAAESATSTTSATSKGLQAGYYQLHEHMQASLAYAALTNPKNVVQTTVTVPEGKRAVDVIAIIANKTKIPLKNFQQVLAHPGQLGLPSYANGKVEGYLFPATYAIVPHETALQILQAMVQRFNVQAQQDNLVAGANALHLTPTKLIIEASLAQAEGGSVTDYPKIVEVINNRIAKGMHLQFDSTVLYGLGKYAVSATFKQINTPGPYNTYLNAGLPAGPISNPGESAIQAVLHPAQGDFLYFLTKPGGKSEFSATPLKGQ
jgi:uncharacterized YceG family protein